jgi:hypothetical protein
MTDIHLEQRPGCGALLARIDGPTHRYIGASPACWAIFTRLVNAGEPSLAYVAQAWATWSRNQLTTVIAWYDDCVLSTG